MHSAYVGLQSDDPVVHDNAVEFLDSVLPPEVRALVVPLFDRDVPVADADRSRQPLLGATLGDREEAIEVMALSHDPWLRSCAAYAMGEMRLTRFAATLDRVGERQPTRCCAPPRSTRARSCATPPPPPPAWTRCRRRISPRFRPADGNWQLRLRYAGPMASAAGESGHFGTGRAT